MLRKLLSHHILLLAALLHLTASESCRPLAPFCQCRAQEELTINNRTVYLPDVMRLDCEAITSEAQFLRNRNLSRIQQPFDLKISNTPHTVVESILEGLSSSAGLTTLRANLNGLILSNLSDIHKSTFDFNLTAFEQLRVVQFTSNPVAFLNCSRFGGQVQQIDLSRNQLRSIYGCSLVGDFKELTDLDLSRNNLTFFELNKLNDVGQLLTVNLAHNEWDCNKDLEPLIHLAGGTSDPSKVKFLEDHQLKCGQPRNLAGMVFKTVWEIQTTEICSKCDCYSLRGNLLGLNCTSRGLTEIPTRIPSNTKIVNFDHNSIERIDMQKLNKQELAAWANVIHLSIQHNRLSSLEGLNFTILSHVRLVNLTHNRLTSVAHEMLIKLNKMDVVRIGSNPWICDCNAGALIFQRWIRTKKGVDVEAIKCNDEDQPIYKLEADELCRKADQNYYWIGNVFFLVFLGLLVFKLAYDYVWKRKTGKMPYFFAWNW